MSTGGDLAAIAAGDVDTQANATTAIGNLDTAIAAVATQRALTNSPTRFCISCGPNKYRLFQTPAAPRRWLGLVVESLCSKRDE